ncbi:hypothetical protein HK097_003166 [Rhizophlyctis rosea]|uniref:Ankyrin n=1 Tax=Rhizophlyctis rosea TaxID=64517 RepID=A0AAD5S4I9_9FUNG|nr:hypothetical protein HK097_003166 [Rhizophlyctis rosea]
MRQSPAPRGHTLKNLTGIIVTYRLADVTGKLRASGEAGESENLMEVQVSCLVTGPIVSRLLRSSTRSLNTLITARDVRWAEAGWRYSVHRMGNLWLWALRHWHCDILLTYKSDATSGHLTLFLYHASYRGDEGMLKAFLPNLLKFPKWQRDLVSREGLYLAAWQNRVGVLKMLLEFGGTDEPFTVKHYTQLGQFLKTRSNIVLDRSTTETVRPIFAATSPSHLEIVKLLLQARKYDGTVLAEALHRAIPHGAIDIVRALLEAGANVNANVRWTERPLIQAARVNNTDMVNLLLAASADVHVGDSQALVIAVDLHNTQMASKLIEHGANVNARDGAALIRATESGDRRMATLLVDAGIKVRDDALPGAPVDPNKAMPLASAAFNGHMDIVEMLLDAGFDVHADTDLALHMAAKGGHARIVSKLHYYLRADV